MIRPEKIRRQTVPELVRDGRSVAFEPKVPGAVL